MTTNSRNYTKLKAILQAVSPGEDNPFPLWQQWTGSFSIENNYPSRNGVELTLINRSSKHCICGHWTGKRDKTPLGKIAACSTPDTSVNNEADEVGELELRRVDEEKKKEKLRLEKTYEDCSLVPYSLGDQFLLSGKSCSKHFQGTSEDGDQEKIVYIRQGKTITATRIHPVFDKSGLRQKLIEIAPIRHLPENLMYFATCISNDSFGESLFEIRKAVHPYGYRDIRGIHKILKRKKLQSPILVDSETATVMCKYAGFAEIGDMLYMKLNFIWQ